MADREESVVVTRTLKVGAERAWAFLADTNRWDRLMGLADATYRWRTNADGTRDHIGASKQYGLNLEWIEPPYEWVEGLFVAGHRQLLSGPVRSAGFRATVTPSPEGASVTVEMYLRGQPQVTRLVAGAVRPKFRASIVKYLDAMERLLSRPVVVVEEGQSTLPIEIARRLLLERPEPALSGPVTSVKMNEIHARGRRLKSDTRVDRTVCEHLLTWTTEAPDEAVESMRPYELARAWKVDRNEALRVFLHATRAGLLDMRWKVNCPVCRVTAASTSTLSDVGRTVHCEACNVSYGVDFASQIEAVFSPNAAVRPVTPKVYCASSAWFRPHLFAVVTVEPAQTREFKARWAEDLCAVRLAQTAICAPFEREIAPAKAVMRAVGDEVKVELSGESSDGMTHLILVNETSRTAVFQVEHASGPADAVAGTAMLTFPDYLDLFATEAPASGVELSIGSIAMLFTDLTGSTALYQQVGDARAFAIIEQHFREMTAVVTRHQGAVIKTMGDAVMATFPTTRQALDAAIEMARATMNSHGAFGMALKVGLHTGACLAVRANDRIDFFGTTVNLAARLQAKALPGEIVVLSNALEAHEIEATVGGFATREFVAPLKGIREEQRLIGYAIPGAVPGASQESTESLDEVTSAG